MNKKILALCLAAAVSASIMTGCKKSSNENESSVELVTEEATGTTDELGVVWPDRSEEMKDILDAVIMAKTENPDIVYDYTDAESFWTFVYYVLVKSGTYCNLAESTEVSGEYKIAPAVVKLFAREVFNAYDGQADLPELPDGFEGIRYDEEKGAYYYSDRGITLGLSEVYAAGDKQDDGSIVTVSYMIDTGNSDDPVITPWKITIIDIRTSDEDSPLYAYRITDIEEVTDMASE